MQSRFGDCRPTSGILGLGLLVESQAAELKKMEGQYAATRLKPFIERSPKVLNTEGWDAETQAKVRVMLAYALRA